MQSTASVFGLTHESSAEWPSDAATVPVELTEAAVHQPALLLLLSQLLVFCCQEHNNIMLASSAKPAPMCPIITSARPKGYASML